jgi:hypothetical protein
MKFKLMSGAILAGLVIIFIIQNVTVMDLRFLFWTLSMSGALLMFFILAGRALSSAGCFAAASTEEKPIPVAAKMTLPPRRLLDASERKGIKFILFNERSLLWQWDQ